MAAEKKMKISYKDEQIEALKLFRNYFMVALSIVSCSTKERTMDKIPAHKHALFITAGFSFPWVWMMILDHPIRTGQTMG